MAEEQTHQTDLEPADDAGGAEDAGGDLPATTDHGAHAAHRFDFPAALAHHNLPYPALEPVHGQPLLIFDAAAYARINAEALAADPRIAAIQPRADYRVWAAEEADGTQALALAKGMELATRDSWLGAFPRSMSWVNQQIFFGTIALLVTALLIGLAGRRRRDDALPRGRLQHVFEAVVLFVRDDIVRPNIHPPPARATAVAVPGANDTAALDADPLRGWIAHLSAVFLAVLSFNLMGLVPGAGTASGNLGVNLAFALGTLGAMVICGMKAQGPLAFWRNLVPYRWSWNPLDMAIFLILLVIELLGLIIKPAALVIRLFANIFGGHTVLLAFLTLGAIVVGTGAGDAVSVPLGVFGVLAAAAVLALELLVAFIQAYVFTLLSAVFIGGALHPEH
ncbi:MAG: F0F1 ATP synthase subunit A [Planctomycetota bacterium]